MINRPEEKPTLISVQEASEYVPMSAASLYVVIRNGGIPGVVRVGGRIFINRDRFMQFLSGEQAASPLGVAV